MHIFRLTTFILILLVSKPQPTAATSSSRAYSVQSVEADQFSQEAIASPSVTFSTATTKKRRRSDDKGASTKNSTATGTAVGAKKRALFYPTKKKRRVQPRSAKGDTGASAKPRALDGVVVQKQANQQQAQATTSARAAAVRGGRPPKGRVEVRTVPPTVRGIHEAARVLLASTTTVSPSLAYHPQAANSKDANTSSGSATEGILSFPTETVYTLTTCITVKPLLRSSSTSSTSSASASEEDPPDGARSLLSTPFSVHSPSLTRLLRLKGRLPSSSTSADHGTATAAAKKQKNDTGNKISFEDDTHSSLSPPVALCSDADPALLYIHTPTQSREFVHFTKPKTFVLKPSSEPPLDVKKKGPARAAASPCESNGRPSSKNTQQSPAQVPAVTFSESREVLDRLTNAFWPGPVIVYAKCKMRKTLREKPLASIREDETSPSSVETPLSSEEDEVVYAPILPTAVLHPYRNAEPSDVVEESSEAPHDNTESPYYVGMRCPSHPLARRALEEVYSRKKQRQQHQASAGSGTSSCGGRRNRSRVVVGFNAKSSTWTACPISAKEVSSQLNGDTINLCPHEAEGTTAFIDVLNGEDEQEMFMAPTCQYGKGACVSLVVDDDAKTIHIVPPTQPKSIEGKKQEVGEQAKMSKKSNISSKDISRALKTSPRAAIEIGNSYEDVAADAEKVASRVISVVLSRWKCVEHKC